MPDDIRGIEWAAFHPRGTTGGANSPDGRLIVDAGLLNGDLLKKNYHANAAGLFAKETLRHRLDSIIAHEETESRLGDHEKALQAAPETELPITERAREICRAMKKGRKS